MTRIRSHGLTSWVALALIGCLVLTTLGPTLASRALAQEAPRPTLLVFPTMDSTDDQSGAEAARLVTQEFSRVTREAEAAAVEVFKTTMPVVRRGLDEGEIGPLDIEAVETGQVDAEVAVVLGNALGADTVVLLSVTQVVYTDEPAACDITLQGQAYDVAANFDPETQGLVEAPKVELFVVHGLTPERPALQATQRALLREAARDAALQAAEALTDIALPPPPPRHRDLSRWLLIALVVAGVIAFSSRGTEGVQVPDETLVPTARTMRSSEGYIRLAWVPPTTGRTIFRYEIRRSENGGPLIRMDGGLVTGVDTAFTDNNIAVGSAYTYEIRVLYTDGTQSEWVGFNQTTSN